MPQRFILVVLAVFLCTITFAQSASPLNTPPPDKLTQVRAADLLSELLTYYGELSITRVDAMNTFMNEIGKAADYRTRGGKAFQAPRMTFQEIFQAAMLFIQQGGSKYSDPALAKMTPAELDNELLALQQYNMQQFLFLNKQRDEIARMRAYLESIGQFDEYLAWSKKKGLGQPVLSTTGPTTRSTQAAANWLADQLDHARAKAWEKAKAQGMTEAEFDAQWKQKVGKLKEDSGQRVDAVRSAGAMFQSSAGNGAEASTMSAGTPATSGATAIPAPSRLVPPGGAAPSTPSAFKATPMNSDDPRWRANYYGPNNPYNNFGDSYSDVMQPAAAGGTYQYYDKRVNTDFDTRVQGEIDRRINVSNDRRLNVSTDPRVNF
jgi:hypothetical protein